MSPTSLGRTQMRVVTFEPVEITYPAVFPQEAASPARFEKPAINPQLFTPLPRLLVPPSEDKD